jgi:hypothetical protein
MSKSHALTGDELSDYVRGQLNGWEEAIRMGEVEPGYLWALSELLIQSAFEIMLNYHHGDEGVATADCTAFVTRAYAISLNCRFGTDPNIDTKEAIRLNQFSSWVDAVLARVAEHQKDQPLGFSPEGSEPARRERGVADRASN